MEDCSFAKSPYDPDFPLKKETTCKPELLIAKDGVPFISCCDTHKVLVLHATSGGSLSPKHLVLYNHYEKTFKELQAKKITPEEFLQQIFDSYESSDLAKRGIYSETKGITIVIESDE